MLELYVQDYVFMSIAIPQTTGRIGLTSPDATRDVRWWPMALPGGPYAERALPVDDAALDRSGRRSSAPLDAALSPPSPPFSV